jgi:hypothetical protein
MKTSPVVACFALGVPLLGFVAWRLRTPPLESITAAVLIDRSESMQNPCAALVDTTGRVLQLSADRPNSSLAVFVTGDLASANQPVLLASREAPTRTRLLKGSQLLQLERIAFTDELKRLCVQQPATRISPIYSALKDAVSHLHAVDLPANDRRLFVVSDLRENVDPAITKALAQPLGTKIRDPLPIDNTAVSVVVCGYAQTRDHQSLQNERLIEVWRQLFADPTLVKFEPFCTATRAAQIPRSSQR